MGLTSWQGAVVRKADVTIAKNYLREGEIAELNRIVTMFLDFAEDQAKRRKQIVMRDWRRRLDDFLQFNERAVLGDAGRMTREEADRHAHAEFTRFEKRRREELEARAEAELVREVEQLVKAMPPAKRKRGKK
jgi:hypothetical protein